MDNTFNILDNDILMTRWDILEKLNAIQSIIITGICIITILSIITIINQRKLKNELQQLREMLEEKEDKP